MSLAKRRPWHGRREPRSPVYVGRTSHQADTYPASAFVINYLIAHRRASQHVLYFIRLSRVGFVSRSFTKVSLLHKHLYNR